MTMRARRIVERAPELGSSGSGVHDIGTCREREAKEQQQSLDAAALLAVEIRRGGLAVAGTRGSLDALEMGQVDMLLMTKTYQVPPGWKCRNCDAVVLEDAPRSCPRCMDLAFSPVSVKEEMVKLAEQHGAAIELVNSSDVIEALGGVGCLLRYQLGWRPGQR